MEISNPIYFKDKTEWRSWLKINHSKEKEIWLVYFKKHTGKPRIPYENAVEEALCYGWIDSTVKRIDDERYCQKFTPRKIISGWSESNKRRVKKLIKEKRMTKYGMGKITAAKENGKWDEIVSPQKVFDMPDELMILLDNNEKAKQNYNSLSASYQRQYINWIASAKQSETRFKRSNEAIVLLNRNQKLGIK
jgi:uncharacterized protein YdeI (YjbR/CyaY-like superfamily)